MPNGANAIAVAACCAALVIVLWVTVDGRTRRRAARVAGSLLQANARRQAAHAELKMRALLDPLTGLPTRLLFEDRLAQAIARQDRAADTVARMGGNEFLLLMEDVSDPAACVDVSRRLLRALSEPFELAGQPVLVSASVGIAIRAGQQQHDKLIAQADVAMHAAKRAGGNTCVVFDANMDAGSPDTLTCGTICARRSSSARWRCTNVDCDELRRRLRASPLEAWSVQHLVRFDGTMLPQGDDLAPSRHHLVFAPFLVGRQYRGMYARASAYLTWSTSAWVPLARPGPFR